MEALKRYSVSRLRPNKQAACTPLLIVLFVVHLLLATGTYSAHAQGDPFANTRNRPLYEAILRIQDRRSLTDRTALDLFTDTSVTLRRRAILAYASIQDTTILAPLLDRFSNDPAVSDVAAFTIGQTATLLSRKSVEALEHELIWERIDQAAQGSDQMISEIGKFGTEAGLADLVNRFTTLIPVQHYDAVVMAIARFGIRGITNDDATRWLLTQAHYTDRVSWRVLYALQRIGRSPVTSAAVQEFLPIYRDNRDPLVRMNYATLLGKLRDDCAIEPLGKLADFDPDWRVRINALKALGNFDVGSNPSLLDIFRRAFLNQNTYIAITSINIIGNQSIQKGKSAEGDRVLDLLHQMASNPGSQYLWQLQAEADLALAKIEGVAAVPFILKGPAEERPMKASKMMALASTGSDSILPVLLDAIHGDDPFVALAALDSLPAIGRRHANSERIITSIRNACYQALASGDVALVTTAAGVLGMKPYSSQQGTTKLLETLERLRVPFDVEAIQEICNALGGTGDSRAIAALEGMLAQPDRSVRLAASSSLKELTGRPYAVDTRVEPLYTDYDFSFLSSLPETIKVRMETIRGDIDLALYRDAAPFTVMSFLKLATQRGFYRGKTFHRVVPNFVIQGGDPRGDGWGGPEYTLRSEFSPFSFETGTLGMASSGKDTEGSQFFITQSPQPHLDGKYTVFGRVIKGMDVVNLIQVDDHIFDVRVVQ